VSGGEEERRRWGGGRHLRHVAHVHRVVDRRNLRPAVHRDLIRGGAGEPAGIRQGEGQQRVRGRAARHDAHAHGRPVDRVHHEHFFERFEEIQHGDFQLRVALALPARVVQSEIQQLHELEHAAAEPAVPQEVGLALARVRGGRGGADDRGDHVGEPRHLALEDAHLPRTTRCAETR
jgi:hypothetical protein